MTLRSAESFSILRSDNDGSAEITLHQRDPGDDRRYDIVGPADIPRPPHWPEVFDKAIIENAAGRTTEIVVLHPVPCSLPRG